MVHFWLSKTGPYHLGHSSTELLRCRNTELYHYNDRPIYLTASLRHVSTDFLAPVLAFLDEDCAALLGVDLLPHHGLVGGDVHTELLGVQVHGGLGPSGLWVARSPPVDQVLTVRLHSLAGATENKIKSQDKTMVLMFDVLIVMSEL